ncbi:hypothetical protein HY546_03480 [archaeon]|nr:hypothetical protein [archaeon]
MVKVYKLEHGNHKFLFIDDKLWMWDTPQEKALQKQLADRAYGNVLVVGYGIGLLPQYLMGNPKVESVTTVEKYKEVIEECGGAFKAK